MSQASSGFTPPAQIPHGSGKGPAGAAYIPNDEERRVFRECNSESFRYRSLPFSAVAMAVAQVLVSRGVVAPSPRFGSLPKVAIAGIFGYISGKMSYMKVCQEKFMKLGNSPLGEALRLGRLHQVPSDLNQSDFEDANPSESQPPGTKSVIQSELSSGSETYSNYTSDYTYSTPSQSYDTPSSGFSDSGPVGVRDNDPLQALPYQDDDVPKKKAVLYEDLRSKNRENYEVTLTQKADTLLKPQAGVTSPKREVKKTKYGDAWEE